MVKEEEYDRTIALTDDDITYETYEKEDEDYFVNYYNDDYFIDVDVEAVGNPIEGGKRAEEGSKPAEEGEKQQ
jgi:hypothetical protein